MFLLFTEFVSLTLFIFSYLHFYRWNGCRSATNHGTSSTRATTTVQQATTTSNACHAGPSNYDTSAQQTSFPSRSDAHRKIRRSNVSIRYGVLLRLVVLPVCHGTSGWFCTRTTRTMERSRSMLHVRLRLHRCGCLLWCVRNIYRMFFPTIVGSQTRTHKSGYVS